MSVSGSVKGSRKCRAESQGEQACRAAMRRALVSRAHAPHDKSSASQLPEHDEHHDDPGGEKVPPAHGAHIAAPSEEKVPVQEWKGASK